MTDSKDDRKFNDTLKRLMGQKPKPQKEMKKGRKPSRDDDERRKER